VRSGRPIARTCSAVILVFDRSSAGSPLTRSAWTLGRPDQLAGALGVVLGAAVDGLPDLDLVDRAALAGGLQLLAQVDGDRLGRQDDRQALVVELRPPGPAGHLVELGRGHQPGLLLDELAQRREHHGLGRQVDPGGDGLGRHHEPQLALERQLLDELLVARQDPGVVDADAVGEQRPQLLGDADRQERGVAPLVDLVLLGVGGEAPAALEQARDLEAQLAAEGTKMIAGTSPRWASSLTTSIKSSSRNSWTSGTRRSRESMRPILTLRVSSTQWQKRSG
jgi:hypothetical protein